MKNSTLDNANYLLVNTIGFAKSSKIIPPTFMAKLTRGATNIPWVTVMQLPEAPANDRVLWNSMVTDYVGK